ncbi:predicted protein [Scheffersomyces stipitis CBS 6054]|uniref:GDP/GTP exchange factor Sec2 N-terminal domain-containing protein n=1 Tax=Scheffersomyces stipitis (strain ATCC 58785 / CBS 6054 / NBRC 10063 / NRRL Y-11545) TaxID=322104 RepID=A3GHT0_PICST|nr:predicted protein [Scheffersomyces stipitis CBS 6054]EAZ62872.2 predicted protein [Scheffersomyces stipitis CBS 6054]
MSSESLDERLTAEITSLSTKLVTAVAKQSDLEEAVLHLRKELQSAKLEQRRYESDSAKYKELVPRYTKLREDFQTTEDKMRLAETERTRLEHEVEDLTASLFDEANTRVSNAARETHNYKVKNKKLQEELEEKQTIIDDLQEQLKDLKILFIRIDNQQRSFANSTSNGNNNSNSRLGTPRVEQGSFSASENGASDSYSRTLTEDESGDNSTTQQQLRAPVFSPLVSSIRLDLNNYNHDFKAFVYLLIRPSFQFDFANLKNTRFFRKIWTEEIENSISVPPLPSTSSLMNRWSKGKSLWNSIVEGRAVIQPVKGVNEVFKLAYKGGKDGERTPVAIKDPCGFCGECRDDILEHSRLYYIKLLETSVHGSNAKDSDVHDVIAQYPLCNYCLIKLRNICDLFAKLRLIHSNIYNLKQNHAFEEFGLVSSSNFPQFKRTSSGTGSPNLSGSEDGILTNTLSRKEESKLIKIYIMLALIRNKIFWSKLGFWDNAANIDEINVDEIHYETFKDMISSSPSLHSKDSRRSTVTEVPSTPQTNDGSAVFKPRDEKRGSASLVSPREILQEKASKSRNNSQNGTDEEDTDNERFADSSDKFQEEQNQTNGDTNDQAVGLERKNSKSKQFTKKMNKSLEHTIEMLKESIEDS